MEPDFSGYATRANIKCSDGVTIMKDAFAHQDQMQVPLVWAHGHNDLENVLGHAILKKHEGDMRVDAFFNDSPKAKVAKELVRHGDVESLSIWANNLVKKAQNVMHGAIREVSLVLAGANEGAKIDFINIAHADGSYDTLDDEAIIFSGEALIHADEDEKDEAGDESEESEKNPEGKTVQEVLDGMTEEQKDVVHYMVGVALDASSDDEVEHTDTDNESITHQEGEEMTRNVFEQSGGKALAHDQMTSVFGHQLSHSQMNDFASKVFADFQQSKSFKDSFLAHAGEYGITNIEVLFPDAKLVDNQPEWITRDMEWVSTVLNGAKKLPFSRIKSRHADLTHEEARAKGYIKADLKKEQYFAISQRETSPQTIYKKQKLDRDDIIDITEFDVVNWIWQEMRFMLREEIARAILIGDGRDVSSEDKIKEDRIRPIASDDPFYTHPVVLAANTSEQGLIDAIIRARKHYKGSGAPTLFTTEDVVTDLLLMKDKMGRDLFESEDKLRSKLRVSAIVPVEVLEGHVNSDNQGLLAVLVNMSDYSIGTDRGGEITNFDDFDIDYNQHKYLIEGRSSGALTKYKTAVAIWRGVGTGVTPTAPTFDAGTNTITIPSKTGVVYLIDDEVVAAGSVVIEEDTYVEADPDEGYFFAPGTVQSWVFEFNEDA